jgi:hypothetical protein
VVDDVADAGTVVLEREHGDRGALKRFGANRHNLRASSVGC